MVAVVRRRGYYGRRYILKRGLEPRCTTRVFVALRGFEYNTGMREYYVHIMANKRNGTLYFGITDDLAKRIVRHKQGRGSKFVQKYNLDRLVYHEKMNGYREARSRERQLKWWERKWKLALIEQMNPEWRDLSQDI